MEKVVSLREMVGRCSGSPKFFTEGWTSIVVGSVTPLRVMAGGVLALADMMQVGVCDGVQAQATLERRATQEIEERFDKSQTMGRRSRYFV